MIHNYQTTKSCGCAAGCQCGCHSAVCESTSETGLSRPNFFAGQLLTDEDLRDALNYVIEKNRLHNRHFLGEGVVCGLEVRHHPCPESQRKVIVKPGHALDCCGNDIVVQCEEELDILDKVRELLAKHRGRDCGDPCDETQILFPIGLEWTAQLNTDESVSEELSSLFAVKGHRIQVDAPITVLAQDLEWRIEGVIRYHLRRGQNAISVHCYDTGERRYYNLYVRYKEVGDDPVAPFQFQDSCRSECYPSRIRESHQFELSCDDPAPVVDLRSRLQDCRKAIESYDKMQAETFHGARVLETAEQVLVQYQKLRADLTRDDAQGVEYRTKLHAKITQLVDAGFGQVLDPPKVSQQVKACRDIHTFLSLSARALLIDIENLTPPPPRPKITEGLTKALALLKGNLKKDPAADSEVTSFPIPFNQSVITRLEDVATAIRGSVATGLNGESIDHKSHMVGELFAYKVSNEAVKRLAGHDTTLKQLIRQGRLVVDRGLAGQMATVDLSVFADTTDYLKSPDKIREVRDQISILCRAISEILRKCLAEIVLPPCPPCDNSRVLIASLTVENCDVVNICNVSREFVVTGPSLRYWFSDFGILNKIRASSCPTPADIANARLDELERLKKQETAWKRDISPPENAPFIPDLSKRADNPGQWDRFRANEVDALEQTVVEPAGFELLRSEALEDENPDPQVINRALSKLAGRPEAEIRPILERTEDTRSISDVIREVGGLRGEVEKGLSKVDGFDDRITAAEEAATSARDDIEEVNQEVFLGTGAEESRIDKLEVEVWKKVNPDLTDDSRIDALDKEVWGIGVQTTDPSRIDKAEFNHDDDDGTPDRTVSEMLTLLRAEIASVTDLDQLKEAIKNIIGPP